MSFLVLLAALLLQHYRPLQQDPLRQAMQGWASWLEHHFNDDEPHHGKLAWLLAVALPVIVIGIAHWLLDDLGHVPAMLLAIAVLYLTLRLDSFTGHPERIATHLRAEQLPAARARLTAWQGSEAADYSATQVARVSIEQTLLHAHHHVFAPVFWFILLGPAGALAYRLADLLRAQAELDRINQKLYASADEDVPDQYRRLVEEYYRVLSENNGAGGTAP